MRKLRALIGSRGWMAAAVVVLAAFVGAAALGDALTSEPHGAPSSSYATNADGTAAWATLAARNRHPVIQLRKSLVRTALDPTATVVVLNPESLLHSEGLRLLSFVRAGGRLVIGGREPQDFLPALLPRPPEWVAGSARYDLPTARGSAITAHIGVVRTAGEGAWAQGSGDRPLLTDSAGDALLLERRLGRGALLLLADPSPLQNRLLASADDAQLALNLAPAPPAPIVFVESLHGFGEARGLAAVPARWWALLGGLLLAGLLWVLARGRRLGPPERASGRGAAPSVPARGAYVYALSLVLRRAGSAEELARARSQLSATGSPSRLHGGR